MRKQTKKVYPGIAVHLYDNPIPDGVYIVEVLRKMCPETRWTLSGRDSTATEAILFPRSSYFIYAEFPEEEQPLSLERGKKLQEKLRLLAEDLEIHLMEVSEIHRCHGDFWEMDKQK